MEQYKIAEQRFKKTGAGLSDDSFPSFHAMVIETICPWYEQLQPILKDRPNVYPCYTNESGDDRFDDVSENSDETLNSFDSSDDYVESSVMSYDKKRINGRSVCTPDSKQLQSNLESFDLSTHHDTRETSSTNMERELNTSSISNLTSEFDTVTNCSSSQKLDDHCKNIASKVSSTRLKSNKKQKLTPVKAKQLQQSLLRRKKRQIHTKSNQSNSILNDDEKKERTIMIECTRNKMQLEEKRHRDMKEIEEKKILEENKREEERIKLTKERLALDRKTVELNNRKIEMEIQRDIILQAQEKKKLILLNAQVLKARREMIKDDPNISKEMLDQYLPLDI
jgi:hypothetical protein